MLRVAPCGSTCVVAVSWLEPGSIGSRNGSQHLFDKFELFL